MSDSEFLSVVEWSRAANQCVGTAVDIIDYNLRPLNSTGGFLGEHHLATVLVRLRDSKQSLRHLKFFIKGMPNVYPSQKWITKQTLSFEKEVFALSELFPKFKAALKKNGKGMEWTCNCYFTRSDIIILEDLSQEYSSLENRGPIEYNYVELSLKALANMHSATLIYEETRQSQPYRLGNIYPKILEEAFFKEAENHPGKLWLNTCFEVVCTLVKEIRGEEAVLQMKKDLEAPLLELFELQKESKRFRNVVCQGDIKRDNILFRHEDGVPVEARIIDFQLVRYTPPANDVMTHIYISTNRKFRDQYWAKLMKVYYGQLSQNLRLHDLDPEKVLSWEEFKESCGFYKKLGLTLAPCYGSFTFFKPEHVSHVFASDTAFRNFVTGSRATEVMNAYTTDPIYKELITEIIEEYIEVFVDRKCN